jgi:hypothetical protein
MSIKKMFVLDADWSPDHIRDMVSQWWQDSMHHNGVMVRGTIKDWMDDNPEDSMQYQVAKWIKDTYTDVPVDETIGIHYEW